MCVGGKAKPPTCVGRGRVALGGAGPVSRSLETDEARRWSPPALAATRPPSTWSPPPRAPRVPAQRTAIQARGERRVPDARNTDRLAIVERGEIQPELGVLDGVGREHVHAERRHAPLEPL